MAQILDTIVATKKKEVAALNSRGIHLPKGYEEIQIDPPRGF